MSASLANETLFTMTTIGSLHCDEMCMKSEEMSHSRIIACARHAEVLLWRIKVQRTLVDVILATVTLEAGARAVASEADIHTQILTSSIVHARIRHAGGELVLTAENRWCKVVGMKYTHSGPLKPGGQRHCTILSTI